MTDLDLSPHPLVVGLAVALGDTAGGAATLAQAKEAAADAQALAAHDAKSAKDRAAKKVAKVLQDEADKQRVAEAAEAAAAETPENEQARTAATAARDDADKATQHADVQRNALGFNAVTDLVVDLNTPELSAFAGYLGGTTEAPPSTATWRILYLDSKLLTWLLVQQDDILFHMRIADDKAAFNERDVIWVRADAPVGRSSGSPSVWLSGDFTRAMDFTPPLAGGTAASAATGIFCEALTAGCCPPRTSTPRC